MIPTPRDIYEAFAVTYMEGMQAAERAAHLEQELAAAHEHIATLEGRIAEHDAPATSEAPATGDSPPSEPPAQA